jgi:hypothetical protein
VIVKSVLHILFRIGRRPRVPRDKDYDHIAWDLGVYGCLEGGRPFNDERVKGGTLFSAMEKETPGNWGNVVPFRGLEGSKIAY